MSLHLALPTRIISHATNLGAVLCPAEFWSGDIKGKRKHAPREPNAVAFKYKPLASQIGSHGLWLREFGGMKHPGFSE